MAAYGRRHTLTLPSGAKIRARRPSALSLIAAGGFPADLTGEVWKLVRKDGLDPEKIAADAEGIKTWAKLIDAYVPFVPVGLKLVPASQNAETQVETVDGCLRGTIVVEELTDMDKQVIFLFGNGVCSSDEELAEGRASVEQLERFRGGQERADAGPGGETVRAEAVAVPGDGPGEQHGA